MRHLYFFFFWRLQFEVPIKFLIHSRIFDYLSAIFFHQTICKRNWKGSTKPFVNKWRFLLIDNFSVGSLLENKKRNIGLEKNEMLHCSARETVNKEMKCSNWNPKFTVYVIPIKQKTCQALLTHAENGSHKNFTAHKNFASSELAYFLNTKVSVAIFMFA